MAKNIYKIIDTVEGITIRINGWGESGGGIESYVKRGREKTIGGTIGINGDIVSDGYS